MGATTTDNLAAPKPISTNQLDTDVERIRTAFDAFDAAIAARATTAALTAHVTDPAAHSLSGLTPASIGALADVPGSVTDSNLGNRTVTQDSAPSGNTGTLTALLSGLANRIRAIMGTTNWWDAPPVSLTGAQSHIGNTNNPHNTTAAQVGAIPATGGSVNDTYIGSRTASAIVAPSAQSNNGVELTTWLGWFVNRIRAITGTTNWYDTPATTLAGAATHAGNTNNPHNTTPAQIGAPTTAGVGATGTWGISVSGTAATASACSGNAATATKLATARSINGVSFDGSANITIPMISTINRATLTIGNGNAIATHTISPSVNTTKTFVNFLGASGTGTDVRLALTNGTTLTATRTSTSGVATVSFEIVECL